MASSAQTGSKRKGNKNTCTFRRAVGADCHFTSFPSRAQTRSKSRNPLFPPVVDADSSLGIARAGTSTGRQSLLDGASSSVATRAQLSAHSAPKGECRPARPRPLIRGVVLAKREGKNGVSTLPPNWVACLPADTGAKQKVQVHLFPPSVCLRIEPRTKRPWVDLCKTAEDAPCTVE
jgi:hypothetical protein